MLFESILVVCPTLSIEFERYGNLAVLWQGGLGISQDFGKHGTVYAEYVVDNTADIPDFHYIHDLHGSVAVGLMYRFGPTTKDAERIASEKKFNQEKYIFNKQILYLRIKK